LQEQAQLLSESSARDLVGKVTTTRNEYGQIEHELVIVAPFLNNYEVGIVRAVHGALTYPVSVYDLTLGDMKTGECPTEQVFESVLEKVFTSKNVRLIISSLRSQSPKKPGGLAQQLGPPS
jgi:hypothetical protein